MALATHASKSGEGRRWKRACLPRCFPPPHSRKSKVTRVFSGFTSFQELVSVMHIFTSDASEKLLV